MIKKEERKIHMPTNNTMLTYSLCNELLNLITVIAHKNNSKAIIHERLNSNNRLDSNYGTKIFSFI